MGHERRFGRAAAVFRLGLALALAAGPAAGQVGSAVGRQVMGHGAGQQGGHAGAGSGPAYRTVAQAWNGVAPCLARPPEGEAARREHLLPYVTGARRIDAEVAGYRLAGQPEPLVRALQRLVREAGGSPALPSERTRPPCSDIRCVAMARFGPELGPRLVHLAVHHRYLASAVGRQADERWNTRELDEIGAALDDLPETLSPLDHNEYRALTHRHDLGGLVELEPGVTGQAVAFAGEGRPGILVTEAWHGLPRNERRVAILHEFAHEFLRTRGRAVEWRGAWRRAVEADRAMAAQTGGGGVVSAYADGSVDEDFAESFTAYRYMAPALKRSAPARYAFLRDWVFDGLEYGQAARCDPSRARSEIVRLETLRTITTTPPHPRLGAYVAQRCRQEIDGRPGVEPGEAAAERRECFVSAAFEARYRAVWAKTPAGDPVAAGAALEDVLSRSLFMQGAVAGITFDMRDRLWNEAVEAVNAQGASADRRRTGREPAARVPAGS